MIPPLPLDDAGLRAFVATLGLGHGDVPMLQADGTWDEEALWKYEYRDRRFADWRETADRRYEGVEDEDVAREMMAKGQYPVSIAGDPAGADELFKDSSGSVFLRVPGARTVEGTVPIFFFDHDKRDILTVSARSRAEHHARKALEVWAEKNDKRQEVREILEAPILLDPSSLHGAAGTLFEGWRRAIGAPESPPAPIPPAPVRKLAVGPPLDAPTFAGFKDAYNSKYILAQGFNAADLEEIARPFLWFEKPFEELDFHMRNCMARMLALVSLRSDGKVSRWKLEGVMDGLKLLDAIVQNGQIAVAPNKDPIDELRTAADAAADLLEPDKERGWRMDRSPDDGKTVLDDVPPMKEFHEGWRGIVPDALLDQGDRVSYEDLKELCAGLVQLKNAAYNLVRKGGDDHVDNIAALLPRLLPADQLYLLHGLDAFPKNPAVIALYERVIAETAYDHVREKVTAYLSRVRTGKKPTGWE